MQEERSGEGPPSWRARHASDASRGHAGAVLPDEMSQSGNIARPDMCLRWVLPVRRELGSR